MPAIFTGRRLHAINFSGYDAQGNRIATWSDDPADGTVRCFYDGIHQFVRVKRSVQGEDVRTTTAVAVYLNAHHLVLRVPRWHL